MGGGLPNSGLKFRQTKLAATIARDTATVNIKSWLAVRFVAANPGTWILHCQ
jgi:FtsP/CotA-like multicopper oxidase with cupredoxin domain